VWARGENRAASSPDRLPFRREFVAGEMPRRRSSSRGAQRDAIRDAELSRSRAALRVPGEKAAGGSRLRMCGSARRIAALIARRQPAFVEWLPLGKRQPPDAARHHVGVPAPAFSSRVHMRSRPRPVAVHAVTRPVVHRVEPLRVVLTPAASSGMRVDLIVHFSNPGSVATRHFHPPLRARLKFSRRPKTFDDAWRALSYICSPRQTLPIHTCGIGFQQIRKKVHLRRLRHQ